MELEVVQIVQELSTAGGAERVAWELARAFGRAGLKNKVVATTLGEPIAPDTSVSRVAGWLSRIPTRGAFRHFGRAIVVPLFTIAATFKMKRFSDAVVLSHGDCLVGDALVVHAVNSESLAQKRKTGHWLWLMNPLHLWVWCRDRFMIAGLRYEKFVAVSARTAKELQSHFNVPADRICIIPNGVDLERFVPIPAARKTVRHEFGIPDDAKLLVFVGHEFQRKGLAHVIQALQRLGRKYRLLVIGADSAAAYRKMAGDAADRVVFAGSRADMPEIYAAADALVLPTSYETFSLVCLEAMACEVPVFATRVGGIEDYLQDGLNGYAISTDPDDIVEKVDRALSDGTLYERMKTGARATAQNYSWDSIAHRYIEMMMDIKKSRKNDRSARIHSHVLPNKAHA